MERTFKYDNIKIPICESRLYVVQDIETHFMVSRRISRHTTEGCFQFLEATFRNDEFRGSPQKSQLNRGTVANANLTNLTNTPQYLKTIYYVRDRMYVTIIH